jgi:hypothetical protein
MNSPLKPVLSEAEGPHLQIKINSTKQVLSPRPLRLCSKNNHLTLRALRLCESFFKSIKYSRCQLPD